MTTINSTRLLASLFCSLASGTQTPAQAVAPQPPSESEVFEYLENMYGSSSRKPTLSRSQVEQLRLRIDGTPQVSIPLLRKIMTDGRSGPGRANNVASEAESVLRFVARTLSRDSASGRLVPAIERISPPLASPPGYCALLDVSGDATIAQGLTAHYSASGQWYGSRPSSVLGELRFSLTRTEGRVKSEEIFAVPLAQVARLVVGFEHGAVGSGAEVWSILLHDGREITIHRNFLEESGPGSVSPSRRAFDWYSLKSGEVQGEALRFWGFGGQARSASGRVGRLEIGLDDVAVIRCRELRASPPRR